MVQRRRHYVNLLMNVFVIMNISNPQHRMYYDDYSMNVFNIATILMGQLGTSCVFDSPGVARNEPTPGKRSQGDSMLYTLRLLGEHIVFVSSCVSILGPTP